MFPLDAVGAGLLFTHLIAAAVEIWLPGFALYLDITATIKTDRGQGALTAALI